MFKKKLIVSKYKNCITYQQDDSDCGVACLNTILNIYSKYTSLENLRNLSGTNITGTSILGMCQASEKFGITLKAEKYNEDVKLDNISFPSILLISITNLNHYIVLLDQIDQQFLLFDPKKGLLFLNTEELKNLWNTNTIIKVVNIDYNARGNKNKYDKNWLKKILIKNKYFIASSILLVVISNILNVSVFLFLQKIVDLAIPLKDFLNLISFSIFILFAVCLKAIISYIKNKLNNIFISDTNLEIIDHFTDIFFKLPKSFFSHKKPGEVVARFNDSSKIQEALMFLINESLRNSIMIIISLPLIFYFSVKIGVVTLISIVVLFLTSFLFSKKIAKHQQLVLTKNALRTGGLINIVQGIDYLRIANKTNLFSLKYKEINKSYQQSIYDISDVKYNLMFTVELLSGISMLLVLILCSLDAINGTMQVGQLIAIFSLFVALSPSIVSLPFIILNMRILQVSVNRVNELEDIKLEDNCNPNNIWKFDKLEFNKVFFNYPGCKPILKNMNLKISKNQFVCLIGESGIGKSTLINLIVGFSKPTKGSILINDKDSNSIESNSWNKIIGCVEQNVPIYNGDVFFNISLNLNTNPKDVVNFCTKNGIHDFILNFPQAYLTQLGDFGHELSNGQRQVIGLARVLFKKPHLLILDEPSSALDYKTESIIMNILARHRDKMSILLVTHRFNLTFMADVIHIIEDGNIKVSGTHDSLLEKDNFYSRYYKLLSLDV